jgi:hypothetical protein
MSVSYVRDSPEFGVVLDDCSVVDDCLFEVLISKEIS